MMCAKTFTKVIMPEKILKRSFEYLHKAAPSVTNMSAYVIEEDVKSDNLVLRKIVNCSGGKVEKVSTFFTISITRAKLTSRHFERNGQVRCLPNICSSLQ